MTQFDHSITAADFLGENESLLRKVSSLIEKFPEFGIPTDEIFLVSSGLNPEHSKFQGGERIFSAELCCDSESPETSRTIYFVESGTFRMPPSLRQAQIAVLQGVVSMEIHGQKNDLYPGAHLVVPPETNVSLGVEKPTVLAITKTGEEEADTYDRFLEDMLGPLRNEMQTIPFTTEQYFRLLMELQDRPFRTVEGAGAKKMNFDIDDDMRVRLVSFYQEENDFGSITMSIRKRDVDNKCLFELDTLVQDIDLYGADGRCLRKELSSDLDPIYGAQTHIAFGVTSLNEVLFFRVPDHGFGSL